MTAPLTRTAIQISCAGGHHKWLKITSLVIMDKNFYDYTLIRQVID